MKNLLLIAKIDIKESIRSRWFLLYLLVFAGLIAIFFVSGVIDSRVSGFNGLSRMLLLFVQICVVVLPIFVLISTVRTICADREQGALEYLLSFSLSLKEYYFGKVLGRMLSIFLPILFALFLSLIFALIKGASVPWGVLGFYSLLLCVLSFVFLSFGFLISSVIKNSEMALGFSFLFWLFLLAFLDIALIGLLMQHLVSENIIFSIAILNPMEVFRIAALALFDTNLSVMGATSSFVLDVFGRLNFLIFSILYPFGLSLVCFLLGYYYFSKKDLV